MAYKTGTNIKTWAESLTEGDTITDANALLWINEFLTSNLRADAMIKNSEDYTDKAYDTWYDLPTDFEEMFRVDEYYSSSMNDQDFYREYFGYEIQDTKIKFDIDGNFRLVYFKLPTELETIDSNAAVDSVFYLPCALWVTYRHLTNDDEDNARNQTLGQLRLQEYALALREAKTQRKKRFKKKRKIKRVR